MIPEKTIRRNIVYRGKILDLTVAAVKVPGGGVHPREVIGHAPAVAVVPCLNNEKVVLIRQYRYAVKRFLWEIPAGLINPGESPLVAAKRELREETGYQAGRLQCLTRFYSSPGYSREMIHLYLATQLRKGKAGDLDEDEFIEARIFSWQNALGMMQRGMICDGKTLLGLTLARAIVAGVQ